MWKKVLRNRDTYGINTELKNNREMQIRKEISN